MQTEIGNHEYKHPHCNAKNKLSKNYSTKKLKTIITYIATQESTKLTMEREIKQKRREHRLRVITLQHDY